LQLRHVAELRNRAGQITTSEINASDCPIVAAHYTYEMTFVGTRINHIFSFCIGGEVPGFTGPIKAVRHSPVIPISPSSTLIQLVQCTPRALWSLGDNRTQEGKRQTKYAYHMSRDKHPHLWLSR
jgi:hypothetical protein